MKTIVKVLIAAFVSGTLLQGCATTQVNKPADALYKDGEQYFEQGNYEDAIAQWKKVKESYQSQELTTRAELGIADAYFLNKDYIEASAAYEDFRKLHPSHERAEYALYRQGLCNYNQINRIDTDQTPVKNALTVFESYMKTYPKGQYLAEVTEKIRDCRDKQIQYEIYVGRFYLNNESYPAAIARFEEALKAFPEQSRRDELLYYLGLSYLESGQKSKGREVFARLTREFSGSRYINDANKAMDKFF
ncbi:MAG TPA: outer membrane protein assembly factor BamD [Desulfuromonadaceae bacterium]|jgi:outer membrane protein assembly factor BamD